jgi:hypothetical protein
VLPLSARRGGAKRMGQGISYWARVNVELKELLRR